MSYPNAIRLPVVSAALTLSLAAGAQTGGPGPQAESPRSGTEPLVPSAAAAPKPSGTKSQDTTGTARAEFGAGVAAYDARDYALAAKHFKRAQELKPHPDVLLNLAQSELLAKQFPEAATHFSLYLGDPKNTDTQTATTGLTQALLHVAKVTVDATAGSEVRVNGVAVGTAPLADSLFLAPGRHALESGGVREVVQASAGSEAVVSLTQPVAVSEQPPQKASIHEEPSPTPQALGRRPFHEWYVDSPVAWVGTGLSVASFVTSGIAAVTASRRYDKSNDAAAQIRENVRVNRIDRAPCGPSPQSRQFANACAIVTDSADEGDTWSTVSVVTLVTGVLLGGATVSYYFIDPNAREEQKHGPRTLLLPSFRSGGAEVSLTGQF